MTKENITISKQVLLKAYRKAEPSQKELLEQLYGAETFASDVMERVKSFQDAVNELGTDNPLVQQYDTIYNELGSTLDADIIAYLKLRIIAAARNEGWEPKFTKDERRYYPYFYLLQKEEYEQLNDEDKKHCISRSYKDANAYRGFVYAYTLDATSNLDSADGVRLAFKTRKLAEYAGKQFYGIWADFVFKIGDHEKTEEK